MDIRKLLKPRTIAVIGVSDKAGFSSSVCKNLLHVNDTSNVYFINPKRDEFLGKKCYKTLRDVHEHIDMAVLCVPKNLIEEMIKQMAEVNCRAAVMFASGYSETGKIEDKAAEESLKSLAKKYDIAIMGPNCAGYINYIDKIPAFGLDVQNPDAAGTVGVISQSGQVCLNILDVNKLDFSYVISAGNSSIVNMEDYLEFLVNDENTKVISIYLEGLKNPKSFINSLALARKLRKPVIILKTGSSQKGQKIANSHTGSLAGADRSFDAIFKKYGAIRADDMEELISTALLLSTIKTLPKKPTFASMNLSGGETAICADVGDKFGIIFPDFKPETLVSLKEQLPDYSSPHNPLDTTATLSYDPEGYSGLVKTVLRDENIGMVICGFTVLPDNYDPCVDYMAEGVKKALAEVDGKPLIWMAFAEVSPEQRIVSKLKEINVPVMPSTLYTFSILSKFAEYLKGLDAKRTMETAVPDQAYINSIKPKALSERDAGELLTKAGIPFSESMLVKSKDEIPACIHKLGFPVAAKICSPDVLHKSDIGGVVVGINSEKELEAAFETVLGNTREKRPEAVIDGVLVQKMLPKGGTEMFIGAIADPQFGPMIMCGLGGIFIEVFRDTALYPAPMNKDEAMEMIKSLKSYKLLTGYRGEAPKDIDALAEVIVKVSDFALSNKNQLRELDINPLFIYEKGVCAADALVVFNEKTGGEK